MGRREKDKARVKKTEEEAGENGDISHIEKLPAEMLENLLKYVDTRSLSKCRGMNRQWCEISSRILRQRPDMEIEFTFQTSHGFYTDAKKSEENKLKDFIHCFSESTNIPWARLSIVNYSYNLGATLEHEHWRQFLVDYDVSTVKCLKLEFCHLNDNDEKSLVNLMHKIRNLLLHKFPHLEEFELLLPYIYEPSKIEPFPPKNKNSAVPVLFQLPNLKVMRFKDSMFKKYPVISRELLNAGVNLKKIQVYPEKRSGLIPQVFEFLSSVGKLHLLKEAEIQLSEKFLSKAKSCTNAPFTFQLNELRLTTLNISSEPSILEYAPKFLSNLFEASKDSLRKLTMEPFGFLDSLQFPRFKNLEELKLDQDSIGPFFPAGVRNSDIFPAVLRLDSELMQDWCAGFPHEDFIPHFPSLKALCVKNTKITADEISVLASLCPNLKSFQIKREKDACPPLSNFLQVGRSIFNEMKGLESLELDLDMTWPENKPAAIDSCLTGFSLENCKRLRKMMEAKKLLEKYGVSVDISESELKAEREHPSILDLTNLRRLTVTSYSKNKPLGEKGFSNRLTWISKEYAFKLMPQLEINGVKY